MISDRDPIKDLIGDLSVHISHREPSDVLLDSGIKAYKMSASIFKDIPMDTVNPRRIAFIDGGNSTLIEAPDYLIALNRVYYSIFKGNQRQSPKRNPRIEFFSYVVASVEDGANGKEVAYHTKIFAYNENDKKRLPLEMDMSAKTEAKTILDRSRIDTIARRFSEIQIATEVVNNELDTGDILIMDGTLKATFKNELKYFSKLYEVARKKEVTICGLSKTSGLITESGEPLLTRVNEISKQVDHHVWYAKVADKISSDYLVSMFVVKLHPYAERIFRFDMIQEENKDIEKQIASVMTSLAQNAGDISMLGYPYGLVDVDRFAQIRANERRMYTNLLYSQTMHNPTLKKIIEHTDAVTAHETLNEVTS